MTEYPAHKHHKNAIKVLKDFVIDFKHVLLDGFSKFVHHQNRNPGKLLIVKCKNKRPFSSLLLFAFISR